MAARATLTSGFPCVLAFVLLLGVIPGCATVDRWTDARIESEVKARLVAEKDANLTRLGVVSSNGTVYLTGTVASTDEKARAEALARGVTAVRRVVNGLQIASDVK